MSDNEFSIFLLVGISFVLFIRFLYWKLGQSDHTRKWSTDLVYNFLNRFNKRAAHLYRETRLRTKLSHYLCLLAAFEKLQIYRLDYLAEDGEGYSITIQIKRLKADITDPDDKCLDFIKKNIYSLERQIPEKKYVGSVLEHCGYGVVGVKYF